MKKAYVASVLANRSMVQTVYDQLTARDYEVVLNWVDRPDHKPYAQHADIVRVEADEMIACLDDLDLLIVLPVMDGGRGMYVEFGAGLMHYLKHGKPQIFVIGVANDKSAFFFHSAVMRVDTVEAMWQKIDEQIYV